MNRRREFDSRPSDVGVVASDARIGHQLFLAPLFVGGVIGRVHYENEVEGSGDAVTLTHFGRFAHAPLEFAVPFPNFRARISRSR
ncbi:MAG: hypothetical protein ACI87A_003212 [Planctomycetota bacterium]|jgi:hypothetical protein